MLPLTSVSWLLRRLDCIQKRLVGRVDRVEAVENFERMRELMGDGLGRSSFSGL